MKRRVCRDNSREFQGWHAPQIINIKLVDVSQKGKQIATLIADSSASHLGECFVQTQELREVPACLFSSAVVMPTLLQLFLLRCLNSSDVIQAKWPLTLATESQRTLLVGDNPELVSFKSPWDLWRVILPGETWMLSSVFTLLWFGPEIWIPSIKSSDNSFSFLVMPRLLLGSGELTNDK